MTLATDALLKHQAISIPSAVSTEQFDTEILHS